MIAMASGTAITPIVKIHSRVPTVVLSCLAHPIARRLLGLAAGIGARRRFHVERATRTSRLSWVFLGIAVVGTIMPIAAVVPWFSQYGVDVPRFVKELFSNRVSAFFAWDVVVSAIAVVVAAFRVAGITVTQRLIVTVGTLCVGVSCGLPLLLFFWTRRGVVG